MAVLQEKKATTRTVGAPTTARRAGWAAVIVLAMALAVMLGVLASGTSEPVEQAPAPIDAPAVTGPATASDPLRDAVNSGQVPAKALEPDSLEDAVRRGLVPPQVLEPAPQIGDVVDHLPPGVEPT